MSKTHTFGFSHWDLGFHLTLGFWTLGFLYIILHLMPDFSSFLASDVFSKMVKIAVIAIAALAAMRFLHFALDRIFETLGFDEAHGKRIATIHRFLMLAIRIAVGLVALLMILSELGLNIGPLLASLGIVGFALTFGTQTLVRDVVSGLFLVLENTVRVGDEVQVGAVRGKVTTLKLRTLVIWDNEETLHSIPYGDIKAVANFSRK